MAATGQDGFSPASRVVNDLTPDQNAKQIHLEVNYGSGCARLDLIIFAINLRYACD